MSQHVHTTFKVFPGLGFDFFNHSLLQIVSFRMQIVFAFKTRPIERFHGPQRGETEECLYVIQVQVHHENGVRELMARPGTATMVYDALVECAAHDGTTSSKLMFKDRAIRMALLTPSSWNPFNQ